MSQSNILTIHVFSFGTCYTDKLNYLGNLSKNRSDDSHILLSLYNEIQHDLTSTIEIISDRYYRYKTNCLQFNIFQKKDDLMKVFNDHFNLFESRLIEFHKKDQIDIYFYKLGNGSIYGKIVLNRNLIESIMLTCKFTQEEIDYCLLDKVRLRSVKPIMNEINEQ